MNDRNRTTKETAPFRITDIGSTIEDVLGHWKNTNPDTGNIASVIIKKEGEDFLFHVFGAGPSGLIDWGISKCITYYSPKQPDLIEGFITSFDLSFVEVQISAVIKNGLTVLQTYSRFKDESNRKNYLGKEFYLK